MRTLRRLVLRGWRRLTSMRTALILLFLLALAAVPGSLLPQRDLNPQRTQAYIDSHGSWGEVLNATGMFDVFGSPWFAAIYLLLFVSLVGCLIPRIRVHARAVMRKPLPAPRNLDRLPESARFEVDSSEHDYATAARAALGRRWRVERRTEESGAVTLSAEKGYSRETGNLVFHIALLVSLVLIAVGRLYNYEGDKILRVGTGFCNSVSNYDSYKPGRFAAEGKVGPAPFCITRLTSFVAKYTANGEPTDFVADVAYQDSVTAPVKHTVIRENHPLRLEGDRVYLIGHGFSPKLTITMPNGRAITDYANFTPTDASSLLSEGVFKEVGPSGKNQDIGINGLFAPTPIEGGSGLISASPRVRHPAVDLQVFQGNLDPNGLAQSVYTLTTRNMKLLGRAQLKIGQTKSFANGVKVTFDGWKPWVSLQVSHDPAQAYLLVSAGAMVLGLLASLGVRRRRIWLRLTPSPSSTAGSPTVVSVGGLARSDSGNFTGEFEALLAKLRAAAQPAPEQLVPAGRE